MSLRSEIQESQYEAMKKGDAERLSILRLLMSAVKNEEIELKRELEDIETQAIASRQVKQLTDAIADFEAGGRADLVEATKKEIKVLSEYMGEQLSDEELSVIVENTIKGMSVVSSDIGKVMGKVMAEVRGKADGNKVREIVSKKLNSE